MIEPRAPGDAGAFDINGGMVRRHHGLARVEVGQGHALINLFEARPYAYPLAIRMLERHPGQPGLPAAGRPALPDGGGATRRHGPPEAVRAFFSDGVQGVNYHAGVWHHMLLAVGAPSRFAVVDRGGEGANCDEVTLARPLWLALPAALASA